jgi:hypothetical protein
MDIGFNQLLLALRKLLLLLVLQIIGGPLIDGQLLPALLNGLTNKESEYPHTLHFGVILDTIGTHLDHLNHRRHEVLPRNNGQTHLDSRSLPLLRVEFLFDLVEFEEQFDEAHEFVVFVLAVDLLVLHVLADALVDLVQDGVLLVVR